MSLTNKPVQEIENTDNQSSRELDEVSQKLLHDPHFIHLVEGTQRSWMGNESDPIDTQYRQSMVYGRNNGVYVVVDHSGKVFLTSSGSWMEEMISDLDRLGYEGKGMNIYVPMSNQENFVDPLLQQKWDLIRNARRSETYIEPKIDTIGHVLGLSQEQKDILKDPAQLSILKKMIDEVYSLYTTKIDSQKEY